MKIKGILLFGLIISSVIFSCSPGSGGRVLAKKTDREKYTDRIRAGGGMNNPAVKAWVAAGDYALNYPLGIMQNYTETGIFTVSNSGAHGLHTELKRGMKISVSLVRKEPVNFRVYLDLWRAGDSITKQPPQLIGTADTATNLMEYKRITMRN